MDEEESPLSSESQPDSFEALLKEAARASVPAPLSRGAFLPAGTTLSGGRLSILGRLGEGGMGVVYEAFDAERRTRVALKTLTRMNAADVYRLKNEFRVLSDVRHENLVALHELWNDGDLWCFTMELVSGERFDQWVRPRVGQEGGTSILHEKRLRQTLPQLIDAVCAIHSAGKLHRDLKPSNVLVTPEGRVVVLDFGLAIDPEAGAVGQTLAHDDVSGTPAYMAPEQAAGRPATTASDFYAIGVMLFEALAGTLPFEGRAGELLAAKQRDAAPRAAERAPGAPSDLEVLCSRLLARDPNGRPGALELRALLPVPAPTRSSRSDGSRTTGTPHGEPRASDAAPELIGREAELAILREAFAVTLEGQPVVLFVSGESGMGKSALCEAFLHDLRVQRGATVLAGRCYERENVPYKAFDPLVDDLSRHLRRLPDREAAALLPRDVHALVRLFPALGRISVVADAPKREIADPHEMQRRAFDAFGEMIGRLRDRQPLVIFIDDLQWTDQDSVRFMRHLLLRPEPPPALVLCAHRSEGADQNAYLGSMREAAADNRALSLRSLGVGPLSEAEGLELTRKLLGGAPPDSTARAIAKESGGSPFFARELALVAQRGSVPGLSLNDAVSAHVAALGDGARRVLQVLALAGQPLPASVVLSAAGMPEGHREVDVLRAERLLRVSTPGERERELECYHDKIREGVSAAMSPLRVRELAAGLAGALSNAAGTDPELLTRCLEEAGAPEAAGAQAAKGADAALEGLAFDRAARLYDKALELGTFDEARLQELRVSRANAFARAGRGVLAADAYLAARQGTQAGSEAHGQLTEFAAKQLMICGQLERGRVLMAEALRRHGVSYPLSLAETVLALAYQRGRLRLRGTKLRERRPIDEKTTHRLAALQMVTHSSVRSDFARSAAFTAMSLRDALDSGDSVAAGRALGWELGLSSMLGAPDEYTQALVDRGEELNTRTGDLLGRTWLSFGRGWMRWMRGELDSALRDLDECIRLYSDHPELDGASYDKPWMEWFRAGVLCYQGRFDLVAGPWLGQLESCWARHDLTLLPNLVGMQIAIALIASGRDAELEREIRRVEAVWKTAELMQQDTQLIGARIYMALSHADSAGAFAITSEFSARDRASAMGRVVLGDVELGLSGALAAYAQCLPQGRERRDLLHRAARGTARLERRQKSGPYAIISSEAARAAIACAEGNLEQAITVLRSLVGRAGTPGAPSPLFIECGRHHLGTLIGGDEGKSLVAEAEATLRKGGCVNPARLAATVVPGIVSA
jgi:hypothetical protein